MVAAKARCGPVVEAPEDLTDDKHMQRALAMAATARHVAPPNPWVGAVIITADGSIYEGATSAPGGAHAEATALGLAPADLSGATAYVTLEPCWPFPGKRTPSCAQALIASRVERVVIAMADPDPRVHRHGINGLRAAGIDVTVGLLEAQAQQLLRAYALDRAALPRL